ncbi:unnamed protein product [Ectocarpus sp. CCAP 1310/34]|nr:unnamed protein product [Ectocarpus sp. CCAP 1310/34]
MRALNHRNVVSIYGFYEDDPKCFYFALELMKGGELLDRIVQKVCIVFFHRDASRMVYRKVYSDRRPQ